MYSGTMPVDVECPRRIFTADEFERMDTAGVFGPEERLELIDGEIVEMAPVGPGHGAAIACLNKRLILGVGDRAVVWIQGGARIALRSLPRPDLALLRPRSYRTANPTPEDILLVIEVADSSLRYDRIRKQRLYASAGIQEYWVANVKGEWAEVYRSPEGEGCRDVRRVQRGDAIAPLSFPRPRRSRHRNLRLTPLLSLPRRPSAASGGPLPRAASLSGSCRSWSWGNRRRRRRAWGF
jgi:Uma2 family endonuclease